jgi:2-desacetyl-2-hydroxyethyl bacteriochlorophyllide A dehydrogenase
MLAIQLTKPGLFETVEVPHPGKPGEGEVLVRVRHVGLCGTDIHAFHGRQPFFAYPRILGHELGVEVEEIGPGVDSLRTGVRCAVEPYLSTPGDRAFARGKTNCAASTRCLGVHCDGGMVERLLLPARLLHPAEAGTESLALVETLCIGHHAVGRADPVGDETAVVVGAGPIGLAAAQFAVLRGLAVTMVDVSATRLERARRLVPGLSTFARTAGETSAEDLFASLGEPPEIVWDCTGNAGSMETSIELAAHGGKVVMVGIVRERISFDDPLFHGRELSLLASRNAVGRDFASVLSAIESGNVDTAEWITHRTPARDFPDVVENWLTPESGLLKGILQFNGDE